MSNPKARTHLLKALAALEDPEGYCRQDAAAWDFSSELLRSLSGDAARSYAIGAAKVRIGFALEALDAGSVSALRLSAERSADNQTGDT
jgi:hypothetical protein